MKFLWFFSKTFFFIEMKMQFSGKTIIFFFDLFDELKSDLNKVNKKKLETKKCKM